MQLACSLWVCKVGAQAVIYSLHALWNSIITQRLRSSEVTFQRNGWKNLQKMLSTISSKMISPLTIGALWS